MSKRSLEFEDCNYSKKPKINESSDYNGCSPLLFFDVYDSNNDHENNNVITELFSDNFNEKTIDTIANGFPHIQSCEKLVENCNIKNLNETEIIQPLNSEIVNCITEKVNTKSSNDFEMENINLEIVNNTVMEIITSEIVNNCDIDTVNKEIVKISDNNELIVESIVTNVTESNVDNQVISNTHVENSVLHENEDKNRRNEINKLPINLLLENHSQESVKMNSENDENMIEGTSEVILDSNEKKKDLLILNNSDNLIENNILPNESKDKTKDENVSRRKSKPEHESLKSDYKLRSSSTKLEISEDMTTPEKNKPIRKSARTPKEKKCFTIEQKTPLNKKGTPKTSKTTSSEKIPSKVELSDKLRSSSIKLEISEDITTPEKNKPIRRSARIPKEKKCFTIEQKTPLNKKGTPKMSKTTSSEKISSKVEISDNENNKTTTVKRRASSKIELLNHSPRNSSVNSTQDTKPFDYNDPATWPEEIPDDMKVDIIKKGPVQIESIIFPRDEKNRCFSLINYLSKMTSGEIGRRFWLIYSKSQDAVYCFACRLFSYDSKTTLANDGSKNWKKLGERLCAHESSPKHWDSMNQWGQFHIDNENTTCGLDLTYEQALSMIGQLKHFSSKISNHTYCLVKQLETELESCGKKLDVDNKQE